MKLFIFLFILFPLSLYAQQRDQSPQQTYIDQLNQRLQQAAQQAQQQAAQQQAAQQAQAQQQAAQQAYNQAFQQSGQQASQRATELKAQLQKAKDAYDLAQQRAQRAQQAQQQAELKKQTPQSIAEQQALQMARQMAQLKQQQTVAEQQALQMAMYMAQLKQQQEYQKEAVKEYQKRQKDEQERLKNEQQRIDAEAKRLDAEKKLLAQIAAARQTAYNNSLTNYKNFGLKEQIDKAIRERTLSIEAKNDLAKLKSDLLSSSRFHRQDAALLAGTVAAYTNAISFLTFDMLTYDSNSPTLTTVSTALAIADNALINFKFDPFEASKIIGAIAISEKIQEYDPLAKAVKAFADFGVKVAASTELPGSQREMRKEIATQVANIDNEMAKYEKRIQQHTELIDYKTGLIQKINNYIGGVKP